MLYTPGYLRGASIFIGTIMFGVPFRAFQSGTAFRAMIDILGRLGYQWPLGKIDPDNFGDDLSSFFHKNGIPLPDVQLFYLIGIVQGSSFNRGSRQQYRF